MLALLFPVKRGLAKRKRAAAPYFEPSHQGCDYPCLPMRILLAPTFRNIMLAVTWLIDALLVYGLAVRVKYVLQFRPSKGPSSTELLDVVTPLPNAVELRRAVRKLARFRRTRYLGQVRIFWLKFIPAIVAAGILNCGFQIFVSRMPQSHARVDLGLIVVAIFAGLLFRLKVAQPIVYGTLEGAFGFASCRYSLAHMSETDTFTPPILIVLFTSIYLMIRAVDNIKRGLDERREKARSILTTIERLSKHQAAAGFRLMFAAIVRSTGKLFFVSSGFRENEGAFTAVPPLEKNSRYSGILFPDMDAEDLWKKPNPRAEYATFHWHELKSIEGSLGILLKREGAIKAIPPTTDQELPR